MNSEGIPTTRLGEPLARWEYRVMVMKLKGILGPKVNGDDLTAYLNEVGDEGWELVAMVDLTAQGMSDSLLVTLKRRQ